MQITNPGKPYMLLRHLPLYTKLDIRPKRFWIEVIGCSEEKFNQLVEEGWFK